MSADRFLAPVRTFADAALAEGRDVYGPVHTPLFVDGLDVSTREPVRWHTPDDQWWVVANLAGQQNLFRTLEGLATLTGDAHYRDEALAALRYGLAHLQDEGGLLYWGGHYTYDAASDRPVSTEGVHEMKTHYPHYPLMWAADAGATRRFIEAFWDAHILDWRTLDMNRHGTYGARTRTTPLWEDAFDADAPVFFKSDAHALSFVNCGSDLYLSAAHLARATGDARPLAWAKRLARQYVRTRNAATGMGGYQFSQMGDYDRAQQQFGPEFGPGALEGTMLDRSRATRKVAVAGICQMQIAEVMGDDGADFLTWAHEDLLAWARHAYDPDTNTCTALFTDGRALGPHDVRRPGYYTPEGLAPWQADGLFLWAYAMGHRHTGDPALWAFARAMARGNGMGDIETDDLTVPACASAYLLLAVLELHRATGRASFLALAERLGDGLIAQHVHGGLFAESARHRYAKFDRLEPLALLHLVGALRSVSDDVPAAPSGCASFSNRWTGMAVRPPERDIIYCQTRDGAMPT